MIKSIAFLLLAYASLFSSSLTLVNDSSFPLIAEIYGAQGDKLFSTKLASGQTYIWYLNDTPFKKGGSDTLNTPFTVRFICNMPSPYDYNTPSKNQKDKPKPPKYQTEFGSWEAVPTGATVNALSCTSGAKTCVVKKKSPDTQETEKQPPSRASKSQAQKREENSFSNWENDGGQDWTNDGGPPWDDNSAP
jgi:hypothetical protein